MFDNYTSIENFKEVCGYTINDVWYPRVTKILSIKAKPALYRYYGEAASFKAAQAVTEKSAEEGTLVHEISQAILLGKDPEVDPSVKPAIDAFRQFLAENNIQTAPEYIERRIVHYDHRYAGTIDALALINGQFGVMDIKTSQGIYRDYNLQTAAYMDALKHEFNLQNRWILRIDQIQLCNRCRATLRTKGGREKVKNNRAPCPQGMHDWGPMKGQIELQEFPLWEDDFQAFLAAKRLWEWENDSWLKRIDY